MTIAQEWWDRKSMGCLWPPGCKGSYSMTTTSVNKNNGSEDTFRVFRCFYCNVKSLFDLLFVTQKSVLQKKNGITFQWVCLHIYPPQKGVSVLVIRVQHCRSPCSRCHPRGGRASRARSRVTAEFTDFPSTAPEIQWSGTMTGAKYFKIEQKKKKSLTNICSCSEFLNNFKWSEDANTTEHTIVLLYKCSWILNRNCPIWLTKN